MNIFIEEDEEATIGCTTWPRVKISSNIEVGGKDGCITRVEVGTRWSNGGNVMAGEEGM